MRKFIYILLIAPIFLISSCDNNTISDLIDDVFELIGTDLTDSEIVDGLKTALEVGTDSASTNLSKQNGYYLDKLVKIPLPPEAEQLRSFINDNNLNSLIDLDSQFENVVKSVNRAAEESAKEAAPIFKNAIIGMSFSDAFSILNGTVPSGLKSSNQDFDSIAATKYFKSVTQDSLTLLYAPKINTALGQDLGLGFSATQAWNSLTTEYNNIINDNTVKLTISVMGLNLPGNINSDLGEYSTEKALDGLFIKVAKVEKDIRRDPWHWLTDASQQVGEILVKVFGGNNSN